MNEVCETGVLRLEITMVEITLRKVLSYTKYTSVVTDSRKFHRTNSQVTGRHPY